MRNHGKETHLAFESQNWDCLTNPSVPTILRLDWENNDNQRT